MLSAAQAGGLTIPQARAEHRRAAVGLGRLAEHVAQPDDWRRREDPAQAEAGRDGLAEGAGGDHAACVGQRGHVVEVSARIQLQPLPTTSGMSDRTPGPPRQPLSTMTWSEVTKTKAAAASAAADEKAAVAEATELQIDARMSHKRKASE